MNICNSETLFLYVSHQLNNSTLLNILHLHSVQYVKIPQVVLSGNNNSYKSVINESPCVILMLNSELFFFCCPINLLANDGFTNMPLVIIMIPKVSSLDLYAILLEEASILENTGFERVKCTNYTKAEGRKYYYSNLSVK